MKFDAVVIGAGHNGLVAALTLSRAGRRVLVLERRNQPGGLCAAEEFQPGYFASGLLQETCCFRRELARRLGLESRGLTFHPEEPPTLVLAGDTRFALFRDAARGEAALRPVCKRDAQAYRLWKAWLDRIRPFARMVLNQPPPPLAAEARADIWDLGRRGLALRRLGREDMLELMRVVPMCAADWLNERFCTSALCEALAAPAVTGGFVGPWSAGTAANLLIYESSAERSLVGGPAALTAALLVACREGGVEIRCGAQVSRVRVANERVAGLQLASGEIVEATLVAASCDPKQVFVDLIHPADLPLRVGQAFRVFRARGTTAKLNLAVRGPLEFNQWNGVSCESLRIGGGHLDELEKAFDAPKYGAVSERPFLEVHIPTVSNPRLAPAEGHVISILIHCAPYHVDGGWTEAARADLKSRVLGILEQHTGPLNERLVGCELLVPPDIEQRHGVTGGQIHHGEHAMDQLLCMRPNPLASRYATPLPGLFLAGAGSHPGGGVTGMPGALAAEAILAV